MNDSIDERMKLYELAEAGRMLMPLLPILARIDGRCFHSFTQGLRRPFDEGFSMLMQDTTKFLMEETGACCGYTQSDEITLAWYAPDFKSRLFFNGRISKMVSVLASLTSVYFNREMSKFLPEAYTKKLPTFDCRVWNVPNIDEGANAFLWREQDAFKNAISMAAQAYYSHKQLHKKTGSQMQEMLFQKGINFNDYPAFFKRGTYFQRKKTFRKFLPQEVEKLPPKHAYFNNPDLMVERSDLSKLDLPPLGRIENRAEMIFLGQEPLFAGGGRTFPSPDAVDPEQFIPEHEREASTN